MDVRVFLAAARHGSFTGASKALKLGQATVSRRVASLEAAIGHLVFDRMTDGLSLTAAGEEILPRAEAMEHAALDLRAALRGLEARPEGVVRVAVPPGLAVDLTLPFAKLFYPKYPGIRLEVLSSLANADLTRGEADLAIRLHRPSQLALVSRSLGRFPMGLFASRSYVASLPPNATLNDLDWIGWLGDFSHLPMMKWIAGRVGDVPLRYASNSFVAQREAACAGLGVVALPEIQAATTAELIEVPVGELDMPLGEAFLVIHRPLRLVPRVRAVADFVIDLFSMDTARFAAIFSDSRSKT